MSIFLISYQLSKQVKETFIGTIPTGNTFTPKEYPHSFESDKDTSIEKAKLHINAFWFYQWLRIKEALLSGKVTEEVF